MVHHCARIAQVDAEQAHRKASPIDNWRLFQALDGSFADPYNTGGYPDGIKLADNAVVNIDKLSTEEIYYWRRLVKSCNKFILCICLLRWMFLQFKI